MNQLILIHLDGGFNIEMALDRLNIPEIPSEIKANFNLDITKEEIAHAIDGMISVNEQDQTAYQ